MEQLEPLDSLKTLIAAGKVQDVLDLLARALAQPAQRAEQALSSHRRAVVLLHSTLSDVARRHREGRAGRQDEQESRRVTASALDMLDEIEREASRPGSPAARLVEAITAELSRPRDSPQALHAERHPEPSAPTADEQIFVSYSRKDRELVRPLVGVLEARGWSVFWDLQILPGTGNWDMLLERKLQAARCIVVVWSKDAAASTFVRTEAHMGRDRGILVAVTLDGTIPPTFALVQTLDLGGWTGAGNDPRIEQVVGGVAKFLS